MNDTMESQPAARDGGFTLVELLIVIVVLGVVSTVVVSAAVGFWDDLDENSCDADADALITAAEAYKAQNRVDVLPAAGATADRYEITLVSDGFLRSPSTLHDIDQDGDLVAVSGSRCTP